ncbi:MAG TPA: helix-turn-helix domain-containing protein [Edaphobacter sp.]|jgi:excisionase family DNA binding protein|nr:helix-turn-helix domain-containing protein [Edaphobacter sp.]
MQTGELLTTKEAAEVLRVSHWTISAWLSQGKLQRTKVGGRTMINRADLATVIEVGGKSRMRVRRRADADAA